MVDAALRLLNAHDPDAIVELCLPDLHFSNPGWEGHDLAALRAFLVDTWAGFPDLHYREWRRISEGGTVVIECIATGTNTGPIRGREATGRTAKWSLAFVIETDG